MKFLFAILSLFAVLLTSPNFANAAPTQAVGVEYKYTAGALNGVNWTPIIASTVKQLKGVSVLNTGAYVLELGIGLAGAASSADVRQLVLPATAQMPGAVYLPLSVGQGYRISVRSLASAGSVYTGELQLNAFYN